MVTIAGGKCFRFLYLKQSRVIALTTTKEGVHLHGRAGRHVDTGVAHKTFLVTTAIDIMEAAGIQVYRRATGTLGFCSACAGEGTATIDIHIGKAVGILRLGIVHEYIALFLHGII